MSYLQRIAIPVGIGCLAVCIQTLCSLHILAGEPATAVEKERIDATKSLLPNKRVVFFGDSITDQGGYIQLLCDAARGTAKESKCRIENARERGKKFASSPDEVVLVNAGLNGGKVTDLRDGAENLYGDSQDSFAQLLDNAQADAAVIYIGINDVWHGEKGTTPDDFRAGLQGLVAECQKRKLPVVLATPSVIGEKRDRANPHDRKLDEYADITRKVAAETGVPLCDVRQAFYDYLQEHNPDNVDKGILTYDGVHMTPAGNQLLASAMALALEKAFRK